MAMEKRNWDAKRGKGWGRGTDGYWYQYMNFEKTGKRQKHVVHTNPFKAVSYEVKKFQNRNKLKQNSTSKNNNKNKTSNNEFAEAYIKNRLGGIINYDSSTSTSTSNEEKQLLEKSKNNIKNNIKNNNKSGALHDENKERKGTLNLYGTDPKTGKKFLSNVHTKHYKTGERLGVLTRNQRRKYDAEAMGDDGKIRTFEGEVAKFEKKTKHGKPHKRKTLYKSHVRSGGKFTKKDSRR